MKIEKLPLHKYYNHIIRELIDNLNSLKMSAAPGSNKEFVLCPDIHLCDLNSQVTILFKIESDWEIRCSFFLKVLIESHYLWGR